MNERLLRRSISLSFPTAPAAVWNAVGADSLERVNRFDRLEPATLRARISDAVTRQLAHLSDEALVALAARSEQTALAELYDRYGRTAYGLALRVLRDQSLAEDAVQEAFLTIWRTASRFMPEKGRASTWILTLVHRRAVDAVRREQRRRADSLELAGEPSVEGVEEDAWLRLQRERVQQALRHLPDTQREALELAYYGGFSQSELAERLGQPLGTIKSRMFTGLSRLREELGEPGTEISWTSTT
jgi:RNA polymerase sigma factor (sigma-70 family)